MPATTTEVPRGIVTMWSGAIANIPPGWHICDGNAGTPNLSSRFVIHADADSGGTYDVGDTGGSTTSGSHTLAESEIPGHDHDIVVHYGSQASPGLVAGNETDVTGTDTGSVQSTGGGGGHTHPDIVPPYYALAYIMKL